MQILLRDALRHPWPLNENVPVFDTLSIYTGSFSLFDLASFNTNVKLTANLVLPLSWLGYDLRPLTSWCFAHTISRGNQRLFPHTLFKRIRPAAPQYFRYLQNNSCEKVAMGLIQLLTSSVCSFGPLLKSAYLYVIWAYLK